MKSDMLSRAKSASPLADGGKSDLSSEALAKEDLNQVFKSDAETSSSRAATVPTNPLSSLAQELIIRGFSARTIKQYIAHNQHFLRFVGKSAREVGTEDIKNYLLYLRVQEGYSNTSLNNVISALKFYYAGILKRKLFYGIKRPKRERYLPVVLTRQEIVRILDGIQNRKHRLLIAVAYGAGLRVGEVVRLRVRDIDLETLTIHVRDAKGAKDRITIFPEKVAVEMRASMSGKEAGDYVFANMRGGALTSRTAQKIFEQAYVAAGVQKSATFHSLRHSFATHVLENGVDARYVQELLGHQSIRTTQHYMHVTNPQLRNIRSPL